MMMSRFVRLSVALVVVFLATGILSCVDEVGAKKALEAEGFTSIELTGYSLFSCGKVDNTCTGFMAIEPSGRLVRGAVGCGSFACGKNCTVRIDPS